MGGDGQRKSIETTIITQEGALNTIQLFQASTVQDSCSLKNHQRMNDSIFSHIIQ
jgi:hypothetical protein